MRNMLLAAALAVLGTGGAAAADCTRGSSEVLLVEDWMVRLGEIANDGTRPMTVELSYRNQADKTLTLVDGDVIFTIQNGEILVAAPIQADQNMAPDAVSKETTTRNIINDPLERLLRASRADVLATACVTLARFSDGSEQNF